MFAARAALMTGAAAPMVKGSAYFNGTAHLSAGNQTALKLGGGAFTVEMWVKKVYSYAYQTFCGDYVGTNDFSILSDASGNQISFYTPSAGFAVTSTSTIANNTWTHVAFVRSGTTLTLYKNGTSESTATVSANLSGSSASLIIGNDPQFLSRYLGGYISNFRIVKGTAVYTSNFTTPTSPLTAISGTSLLTCNSPTTIADSSTNNFSITNSGVTASSDSPFT